MSNSPEGTVSPEFAHGEVVVGAVDAFVGASLLSGWASEHD